jgi:hypothetical protein
MQFKRQFTEQSLGALVSTAGVTAALLLSSISMAQSCPFSKRLNDSAPTSNGGDPQTTFISGDNFGKFGKFGLVAIGGIGVAAITGTMLVRQLKQRQLKQQQLQTSSSTEPMEPPMVEPTTEAITTELTTKLSEADLLMARYAFPITIPSEALQQPITDAAEREETVLV